MLNFCLYKPCVMCLSWLHFQPCAGGEPDCNCCLSNKYTYMQLRSPEGTRVNFHLHNWRLVSGIPTTSSAFHTGLIIRTCTVWGSARLLFLKSSNLNWKEARVCQRGEPRVTETDGTSDWTLSCL